MGTLKFVIHAGAGVRGQVKSAIKEYCWMNDIKCTVEEDKGWINSTYYFTLTGSEEQLIQAQYDLKRWKLANDM